MFIELTSVKTKEKYLVNLNKVKRIRHRTNSTTLVFEDDSYSDVQESYEEIKKIITK